MSVGKEEVAYYLEEWTMHSEAFEAQLARSWLAQRELLEDFLKWADEAPGHPTRMQLEARARHMLGEW